MQKEVDIFVQQLRESSQASIPVDMSPACRYLGLDIVGHLGFGQALHLQTSDTYRFISRAFNLGNYRVNLAMQFPWLLNIRLHLIAHYLPNSLRRKMHNMLEKLIRERLSEPLDAHHDLMYHAVAPLNVDTEDFSGLRQGELWGEAAFFFSAGTLARPPSVMMCLIPLKACANMYNHLFNSW